MRSEDDKRIKYAVSALITIITLLGAAALGVAIILSELLYPEIEEFSDCPDWYKTFLLTSLVVSVYGVVCALIFKRKAPRRLIYYYIIESKVFLSLLIAGFVLMLTVFIDDENYVVDILICVGGAIGAVGLFGLSETLLALYANKNGRPYVRLLTAIREVDPRVKIFRPASRKEIAELEQYLGATIPEELRHLYEETDGDGKLIYSAKISMAMTQVLRETYFERAPEVENLFFFGKDSWDNYVCYRILDGRCIEGAIMHFNNKTLTVSAATEALAELILSYYQQS